MIITGLEKGYGKQIKIFLDEEYAFSLYSNEVRKYQLEIGQTMEEVTYGEIVEMIYRRGRLRALNLLKRMDYTENELRSKLVRGGYTEEMTKRVLEYVNGYHYLDDARYTQNYVEYKKSTKSMKQIKQELRQKGIDSSLIEQEFEEKGMNDDVAITKAIAKKTRDVEGLSYEEKQKIGAYLFRKGFSESDIRRHLLF